MKGIHLFIRKIGLKRVALEDKLHAIIADETMMVKAMSKKY